MYFELKTSIFILLTLAYVVHTSFDALMDSSLYTLNWNKLNDEEIEDFSAFESIQLMTSNQEKYTCAIPMKTNSQTEQEIMDKYDGPDEMNLLSALFKQSSCSYRIEGYWTYELCHGIYLKQYHAERGAKAPKQSYFLGKYVLVEDEELKPETPTTEAQPRSARKEQDFKRVDGVDKAYFAMDFVNGTFCDLTGTPRKAHLHYVCHPSGRGEIHEIYEVRSCEYEVTVLTNYLCKHPLYEIKKDPINKIECRALDDSPSKPRSLQEIEKEQKESAAKAHGKHILYLDSNGNIQFVKTEGKLTEVETEQDAKGKTKTTIKLEIKNVEKSPTNPEIEKSTSIKTEKSIPVESKSTETMDKTEFKAPGSNTIGKVTDLHLIREFLSGEHCLIGGSGWWKHEFCYGKYVQQYHKEKAKKTIVALGNWQESKHISWLRENPSKKPKQNRELRKSVSHYYGSGDVCDVTGEERWTEVKIKCVENPSKPHSIAIFLIEPNPCEYTIVVESQLFCKLILDSDENGLLSIPESL